MGKLIRVWLFVLAAACAGSAFARTPVPIINHENVAITTASGRAPTAAEVAKAIRQGAASMGWEVADAGADKLVATMVVRGKHTISTEIQYTPQSFTVRYRSSVNMNYAPGEGAGTIHPNYNRWVQGLVDSIRTRVSAL